MTVQRRTAPRRDAFATAPAFSSLDDELKRLTPWAEQAACRDSQLDFIEPPGTEATLACLEVCARCPVRRDCLAHALTLPEEYGIWAGSTPKDRKQARLKYGEGAKAAVEAGFEKRLVKYRRWADGAAYRRELATKKATATRMAKKATETSRLSGTRSA